ncbi:NAD(P)-binding oxidoreductase [uncultured Cohaesibacter sp.]|uniref:NAD(P)-dependent oxidoreductase n=1 Tax=uncultured Cohaesibacter sp. TaxID=1002546 RepID=UPI0029C82C45|nr:NAD(P)-binding oxidoreductase [uncultured Cohaesibacter sp.]
MATLIVGASGATGRLLVEQMLNRGEQVKAVVRSVGRLPDAIRDHPNLSIIEASILDLDDMELQQLVAGCTAVASCLGHNLSFKGLFGHPRRLVTDATARLCEAIRSTAPAEPVKFVLMNTTGNRNRDLDEPVSLAQRIIIGLLRLLLPPHVDNEQAADHLRVRIGQQDPFVQWVAVRPDGLVDHEQASPYDLHASPIRSPIFDPGTTSRINVAHLMARLISDGALWQTWKGRMPVIYNRQEP